MFPHILRKKLNQVQGTFFRYQNQLRLTSFRNHTGGADSGRSRFVSS